MSSTQRATIAMLAIAALAVWGLGLRAALRPDARADQKPSDGTAVVEISPELPTPTSLSSATPTPSRAPASATPTGAATFTPAPTASPSAARPASPTATITRPAAPTPAPTTADARQPTLILPAPASTPIIPQAGRFLLVNQDQQVMIVYEDGNEIRTIPVSSGRPVANAFTPAWRGKVGRYWGSGPFLNTSFWSDYMWYLFPGARGSILIHSLPYTWHDGVKIYDQPDALGVVPASHGCVRISPEDAQWLKVWDPVGVPIEITPWSGEIGPPDESLGPG